MGTAERERFNGKIRHQVARRRGGGGGVGIRQKMQTTLNIADKQCEAHDDGEWVCVNWRGKISWRSLNCGGCERELFPPKTRIKSNRPIVGNGGQGGYTSTEAFYLPTSDTWLNVRQKKHPSLLDSDPDRSFLTWFLTSWTLGPLQSQAIILYAVYGVIGLSISLLNITFVCFFFRCILGIARNFCNAARYRLHLNQWVLFTAPYVQRQTEFGEVFRAAVHCREKYSLEFVLSSTLTVLLFPNNLL